MSSRRAKRGGICTWKRTTQSILATVLVVGAAMPSRAVGQDTGFVAWPRELASRAPGLADGIAREFGQRPRMIRFGGRDTIQILFWNPKIWQDDMESKVLPEKTMPIVREATTKVAAYVWSTFGRDAGITYMHVAFVRVVHDSKYVYPKHEVPAQEVFGDFTREALESGRAASLATVLREGGAWPPNVQNWFDSLGKTRQTLTDAIWRDSGELPSDIKLTGRDTIDVLFWNPTFWWKDDSLTKLPEESLPFLRRAAKRAADGLWTRYARDAGINIVRVRFTRVHSVIEGNVRRMLDAQQVTAQFTRQQLDTGRPDTVHVTIVQR